MAEERKLRPERFVTGLEDLKIVDAPPELIKKAEEADKRDAELRRRRVAKAGSAEEGVEHDVS